MDYYITDKKTIVEVSQDEWADSPREWDNLGTIFSGIMNRPIVENESEFGSWDELMEHYGVEQSGTDMDAMYRDIESIRTAASERGDVVLPISAYIHGDTDIYVGLPEDHFDGQWDCTFVGFIMTDAETIRKEYGNNDAHTQDMVKDILEEEVEDLSQYYRGEVYCFTEYDRHGEVIDACGGFFSDDVANNFTSDFSNEIVEELGEYDSIEECLENNQEKLGITIDPITPLSERIHICEEKQQLENDGIEDVERDDDAR